MPPKLCFVRRIFFCTRLDFWILIWKGSLEREEERGSTNTGEGNGGSCMISSGRLDSIGGGSISFFNELDTKNVLFSWLFVSFFLSILTQKMNYAHGYLFHFLMSWTQKSKYAHIRWVPHHMFNEPEEGGVRSHMGPSMYNFTSTEKIKSVAFSRLESLKIS